MCVTTATVSDRHQEAGRATVALHTISHPLICNAPKPGTQPAPPTALSLAADQVNYLKQPAKLSVLHPHFKDIDLRTPSSSE